MGTPRELQAQTLGQSYIDIRTTQPMPADVPAFQESSKHVLNDDRTQMTVYSTRPARTLPELVKWIDQHGIDLEDIHLKRPTLEDVFIELTGKRLRE
jgi:ABC-2 type transport system ATP-binding protein